LIDFEARHVRIPFRFRYGHARKQHVGLDAIVCIARDEEGKQGFGEAVPRSYVTGETCDTVMAEIPGLLELTSIDEVRPSAFQQQRRQLATAWKGGFPSCACCAIDTALHDVFARQKGQSCAAWMGAESFEPLVYSASIGMSKKTKLLATLLVYRALGLKHFKVKVGGSEDIERIRLIRRVLGREVKLFADANAHWGRESAIRHIEALQAHGVWAVEEPLRSGESEPTPLGGFDRFAALTDEHYENYHWLRERSPLPLIADESLICLQSARRIVAHQAFDILNIRLSKCGGPWMSTQIVELARESRLRFAFGAMVGETPIQIGRAHV
jgi:muconate cycloisomerase